VPTAAPFDRSATALEVGLLQCFLVGLIELMTWDAEFAAVPSEHPAASRLARRQAQSGRRVVSLRHRNIELTEFERLVLLLLDGRRDRASILEGVCAAVSDGTFLLHQDGRPITDLAQARPILDRSLTPCVLRLTTTALLEA
jgi:hypothetical protein